MLVEVKMNKRFTLRPQAVTKMPAQVARLFIARGMATPVDADGYKASVESEDLAEAPKRRRGRPRKSKE